MLGIGKLGVGQVDYYLNVVARGVEDYYTGAGEAPGEWMGRGAARLGLLGEVAAEDLRAALGGVDPVSGTRLAGRSGHVRVPGWDLTFSAPKSVSVLFALADGPISGAVVDAHYVAVLAGIGWLEAHATVSRRRAGGTLDPVRGEGLVIGAFRHRTSRAGDPHLHTHALAANMVERVDGGWGALHSPHLYHHARTAGFVYQTVLRAELTERLGLRWGPVVNGHAEIDGIPLAVLTRFSRRRAQIEAVLAERGDHSAGAARTATLNTRPAKGEGVDEPLLRARWAAEAAEIGFDPGALAGVTEHGPPAVAEAHLDVAIAAMVSSAGLTATRSTFERCDVVRGWCGHLPPGALVDLTTLEALTDALLDDAGVVAVHDGMATLPAAKVVTAADGTTATAVAVRCRWSTTELLATEAGLLDRCQTAVGAGHGRVEPSVVDEALAGRPELSIEQRELVRRVTTSGDGVEVVVGRAGTGKTYALAAAAEVWRAAGYRPIGVALAARAAAAMATEATIPSSTVAQFLLDVDQLSGPALGARDVVVVDEAAMVDTRRLARLVDLAGVAAAKVVLVGDHHQLPAVDAGGGFAGLVDRLGSVELAENRRQRETWEKATLARLRDGAGGRAGIDEVVAEYRDRDRLHVARTPGEVHAVMVADWYDATRAGAQAAMIALRRNDVVELNARARALLVADGTVTGAGLTVGERTYATGDRVVCLHNDRRVGAHNALFARVVATGEDGVVADRADTGERLTLPVSYVEAGHLDHAYATTIHKAQGATHDRTLVLGDDRLYRQAGYTALSRGRAGNDLYLVVDDDRDRDVELDLHGRMPEDEPSVRLARSLTRDGAKVLASDEPAPSEPAPVQAPLRRLWLDHDAATDQTGAGAVALAGSARRIAARTVQAGLAAELRRPAHVTALIGDPPVDPAARTAWREAAGAIESHTARWGTEPGGAVVDARQAVDALAVRERVEAVTAPTRVVEEVGSELVVG